MDLDYQHTIQGMLALEDGSEFGGTVFGYPKTISGEVVFNTGMVGYPESLTDPSYSGQILILTYPLIGNYGVPQSSSLIGLDSVFESWTIQIKGLVVSDYSQHFHHWDAEKSLGAWLHEYGIPGLSGVDTRKLTKRLRERGSMLGKVLMPGEDIEYYDPNQENLVGQVSSKIPETYGEGDKQVVLIDCGAKNNIARSLVHRGVAVRIVPWNYDFLHEDFDGVIISNGPGDPKMCQETIANIRKLIKGNRPVLGICLGNQLLALAAGADTYKLKFGHHSQNQPCIEVGTQRCFITSQNHGYAVKDDTLPIDWEPWYVNANDGTNEGIRHKFRPFMSVQFHPEATPGPVDTEPLFDRFVQLL